MSLFNKNNHLSQICRRIYSVSSMRTPSTSPRNWRHKPPFSASSASSSTINSPPCRSPSCVFTQNNENDDGVSVIFPIFAPDNERVKMK